MHKSSYHSKLLENNTNIQTYYVAVGNYNAMSLITILNTQTNYSITISQINGNLTFTYIILNS